MLHLATSLEQLLYHVTDCGSGVVTGSGTYTGY